MNQWSDVSYVPIIRELPKVQCRTTQRVLPTVCQYSLKRKKTISVKILI